MVMDFRYFGIFYRELIIKLSFCPKKIIMKILFYSQKLENAKMIQNYQNNFF